jgi:rhodanese-related sulfurtransferase
VAIEREIMKRGKKLKSISSVLGMLMFISGCAQDENFDAMFKRLTEGAVTVVQPEQAAEMEGVLFLDAREPREFEVSHIDGARCVGYDDFDINAISDLDKSKPVIVYCSVGYRSEKIGEKLLDDGFTDVYNLYGGIFHWVNTDQPVVSSEGKTNAVHAYNEKWGKWLEKGEKVYE